MSHRPLFIWRVIHSQCTTHVKAVLHVTGSCLFISTKERKKQKKYNGNLLNLKKSSICLNEMWMHFNFPKKENGQVLEVGFCCMNVCFCHHHDQCLILCAIIQSLWKPFASMLLYPHRSDTHHLTFCVIKPHLTIHTLAMKYP